MAIQQQESRAATKEKAKQAGLAHTSRGRTLGLVIAFAVLLVVLVLSLAVGAKDISLSVVWDALTNPMDIEDHFVVRELRIPRTIAGLIVGIALGIAGMLIQALTRNPLADPGILGVNAGAAFLVAIAVGVMGIGAVSGYVWFALAGALVVTVAVFLVGSAGIGGADPARLVLAGVAIGAVLGGLTTGMMLFYTEAFYTFISWNAGSLAGRDLATVLAVLPFILAGLIFALFVIRPLNAIALGDDLAKSLGTHLTRTRIIVIVAVTLMAGAATALAGPIAFVGLMIPHVARWIAGPDQRWIFAYSLVLAPILLVSADIVGRVVIRPGEVPVGIITAFIGAPVLIILIRRRKASGL